jgi:hypothetical protein
MKKKKKKKKKNFVNTCTISTCELSLYKGNNKEI